MSRAPAATPDHGPKSPSGSKPLEAPGSSLRLLSPWLRQPTPMVKYCAYLPMDRRVLLRSRRRSENRGSYGSTDEGPLDRGLVVRNDRNKPYVYEITDTGRSYVAS